MASLYSVAQVNSYIKNMFAQDFVMNRISVRGEISNCKYHPSGHIYFTMKDESGTLKAVMFAGQRIGLSFRLEEGQSVVVTGAVDVYERDGTYQLYAKKIELDGRGDLYERFCRLREYHGAQKSVCSVDSLSGSRAGRWCGREHLRWHPNARRDET